MDACARRSVSGSEFWREDPRRCFSSDCEQDSRFAASTQECQTGLWSREPEAEADRDGRIGRGRDPKVTARDGVGRAFRCLANLAQRRDDGQSAGRGSPWRIRAVQAERAISRLAEKPGVHERSEERLTRFPIEAPQALRLRGGQSQSRQVEVFPLHPPEGIADGYILIRQCHGCGSGDREIREREDGVHFSNGYARAWLTSVPAAITRKHTTFDRARCRSRDSAGTHALK